MDTYRTGSETNRCHWPGRQSGDDCSTYNEVAAIVQENEVPPELVINWDQTGAKFVPTSQWTLAEQGVKQVDVIGLEDNPEMTTLLACTSSGSLLPSQLIYGRKTSRCRPVVNFTAGWDVWHSDSH